MDCTATEYSKAEAIYPVLTNNKIIVTHFSLRNRLPIDSVMKTMSVKETSKYL